MKGHIRTLHCDGDDGFCGAWTEDFYGMDASAVYGERVTPTRRSPGWVSAPEDEDFCPEHAPKGGDDDE